MYVNRILFKGKPFTYSVGGGRGVLGWNLHCLDTDEKREAVGRASFVSGMYWSKSIQFSHFPTFTVDKIHATISYFCPAPRFFIHSPHTEAPMADELSIATSL